MTPDASALGTRMTEHRQAAEVCNDRVVGQVVERILATVHRGLRCSPRLDPSTARYR